MTKINIIDIGSVGGLEKPWNMHNNAIDYSLSFEPNETLLKGKHLKYDCAVWNYDGEAKFYVSGSNGTGSSLLKQNFDWVRENFENIKHAGNQQLNFSWFDRSLIKDEFLCQVRKLDTILEDLGTSLERPIPFHFLKSDTQSGEFFVLKGAKKYISTDCLGLDLELFRYPLYEGLITEKEVKMYLKELGFYVAGHTGYRNSFNASSDYLFLRENPRNDEEKKIVSQILKIYQPKGKEKIIKYRTVYQRFVSKLKSLKQPLAHN